MRQVRRPGKVVPIRGTGAANTGSVIDTEGETVGATTAATPASAAAPTETDVLRQLETGITYTQMAASRVVQLVPPGSSPDTVANLLAAYVRVQNGLLAAKTALQTAQDAAASTAALERASTALGELHKFLQETEDFITKVGPVSPQLAGNGRAKLILAGAIAAGAGIGVGIWALARKRQRRLARARGRALAGARTSNRRVAKRARKLNLRVVAD